MTKKASLLLLIYFSVISTGQAMSIFDAGKVCTFSSVRATVTYEGEPVKGAKVTRLTDWNTPSTDMTTTNENGYFELPSLYERSISRVVLPIQFAVSQVITVEYNGQSNEIWVNTKMKPEENSELGGIPINLKCELSNEMKTYRVSGPILGTICTWEQ